MTQLQSLAAPLVSVLLQETQAKTFIVLLLIRQTQLYQCSYDSPACNVFPLFLFNFPKLSFIHVVALFSVFVFFNHH